MEKSALCYFNGKFNIFEYILLNKTCQSYSWVTLSDIISCDTTHEVYISGDISTFLAHNVNCKVTKETPNANLCPENSSGSDLQANARFNIRFAFSVQLS